MANTLEHSIRVTAKGEFGEVERGLKNLKRDLTDVGNVVNKGVRKGGIFDSIDAKGLEIYSRRFGDSMKRLTDEIDKQEGAINELELKKRRLQKTDQVGAFAIQNEIKERHKLMDTYEQQRQALEDLYKTRRQEFGTFTQRPDRPEKQPKQQKEQKEESLLGTAVGGALGRFGMLGKLVMGLAGIGGLISILHESYQLARDREVDSLDLRQRMPWSANASTMYDIASATGRRDGMGYDAKESWQFLDVYSQRAGNISPEEQYQAQRFSRGYGLDLNTVGGIMGQAKASGGVTRPSEFADMIAGSVAESGMTPRILEVMETSAGLLQAINVSLKDGSSKQIMTYQTVLDKIGTEQGMTKLTGQSGANLIQGMQGMFSPESRNQWWAMAALRNHDPEKYGNMGYFGLKRETEKGLTNPDMLPAFWKYIKGSVGNDPEKSAFMLQKLMQGSGQNITYGTAEELAKIMDTNLADPEKMKQAQEAIDKGNSQNAYNSREGQKGQGILAVEAEYKKALERLGGTFLSLVTETKKEFTALMNIGVDYLNKFTSGFGKWVDELLEKLNGWLGTKIGKSDLIEGGILAALGVPLAKTIWDILKKIPLPGGTPGANIPGVPTTTTPTSAPTGSPTVSRPPILDQYGRPLPPSIPGTAAIPAAGGAAAITGTTMAAGAGILGAGIGIPILAAHLAASDLPKKITPAMDELVKLGAEGRIVLDDLSSNGLMKLQALADQGLLEFSKLESFGVEEIADFGNSGKAEIKSLTKEGAEALLKLQKEGDASIKDLGADGKDKLAKMLKNQEDHNKAIKAGFVGMWDDFKNWWKNWKFPWEKFSGTTPEPHSGKLYDDNYDVRNMSGITASQLDDRLGGVLKGQGSAFDEAGRRYGIDPLVLAAIAMHETGNGYSELARDYNNIGGITGGEKTEDNPYGFRKFNSLNEGIWELAKLLRYEYVDKGRVTVGQIQEKYAPANADNDPTGLNNHWRKGVTERMSQFDIAPKDSFFRGWAGKITSRYGDTEGRQWEHKGVDLGATQGEKLDALAGGTITNIEEDRENSTPGGSKVIVQLPNGKSYSYSHLSHINPELKVGQQINRGQYVGNAGGEPGVAGSGTSTTGAHLHLGYYDQEGKEQNPEDLLKFLLGAKGDSPEVGETIRKQREASIIPAKLLPDQDKKQETSGDIIKMLLNTGGDLQKVKDFAESVLLGKERTDTKPSEGNLNEQQDSQGIQQVLDSLTSAIQNIKLPDMPSIPSEVKVSVDVNLRGEGAEKLNGMTVQQLTKLIQEVMTQVTLQSLQVNPVKMG